MKIQKTIWKAALLALAAAPLGACSDFFDPENETMLSGDDYMAETSELYSGFVGVVTKLQAVGDKAILLTDTRAELLEPTGNSPELYAVYNYEEDLAGNSYADPACYYDLVIACNDYLAKARAYKDAHPGSVDMDHYRGLIGGALRLKAWTYFTLARVYGSVVWFDDPMWSLKDYSDYPVLDLDAALAACDRLINDGWDGATGRHTFSWSEWITAAEGTAAATGFEYWDIMLPDYFVLQADICLWLGRYREVVDLILSKMNEVFSTTDLRSGQTKWMINAGYTSDARTYQRIFDQVAPSITHAISAIKYNYQKDQTNTLLRHFNNEYMLRPSEAGMNNWADYDFNPRNQGAVDRRLEVNCAQDSYGAWYFHKYRRLSGSSRSNPLQDDVHINLYRNAELYLMLAEALNHLDRYNELNALMNIGMGKYRADNMGPWPLEENFSDEWTKNTPRGTRVYADDGIRRPWANARVLQELVDAENIRHNDREILHEIILEFAGEGKTYAAMLRMARRYNDMSFITDYVCPKYPTEGKRAEIAAKIVAQQGFVPWDIDALSTTH